MSHGKHFQWSRLKHFRIELPENSFKSSRLKHFQLSRLMLEHLSWRLARTRHPVAVLHACVVLGPQLRGSELVDCVERAGASRCPLACPEPNKVFQSLQLLGCTVHAVHAQNLSVLHGPCLAKGLGRHQPSRAKSGKVSKTLASLCDAHWNATNPVTARTLVQSGSTRYIAPNWQMGLELAHD